MIPVIDLLAGQVVRAVRGERSAYRPIASRLAEGSEPRVLARALMARCAAGGPVPPLYVADLDALQGRAPQAAVLADLLGALPEATVWLDAGFTDAQAARRLRAELGAAGARMRPVYASESLASVDALADLANLPDAVLSHDCRQARPMDPAGCWQRPALWPRTLIVMTLDRVGAGSGPDLDTFARLRAMASDRQWIGAGGIRDAGDLDAAARAGAHGWLVASALHDGRLDEAVPAGSERARP